MKKSESLGFYKEIREWFSDVSRNDGKKLEAFCNAFLEKDPEKIGQIFGDYLWNTISIRDTAAAKELEQIEEKGDVDKLRQDGMRNFIRYGIACFKKDCKVVVGE